MLQDSHEDIEKATEMLSSFLSQFQNLRDSWSCKNDSLELLTLWNIESSFPKKRLHHRKKFFDKLKIDECIEDKEKCFKIEEFYKVIDLVIGQLATRFKSSSNFMHFLNA